MCFPLKSIIVFFCFAAAGLVASALPGERVPEWAKDVIWYQVFPERFANGDRSNDPPRESLNDPHYVNDQWAIMDWTGDWYARADWEKAMSPHFYDTVYHRRYGGDLQGVIDRLDYLQELGVTGLYFNPIFYADSLHKYDGNSFHHIDPHFGPDPEGDLKIIAQESMNPRTWQWTAADKLFLKLLEEAKARDMRVIIDGVWNHTGRGFFAFQDVRKHNQKSRFASWYKIIRFNDPRTARNEFDYHGWWGFKSLPEFAHDPSGHNLAPGPKNYIFHATRRWMDPNGDGDPSDGIDGWRLDVAEEVPQGFWQEWHALVRSINTDAFTSAEIWGSSADFVEGAHFGSAMNYRGFAIPIKGWLIDGKISSTEFSKRLDGERQARSFDAALILQNLVDSHDTQRVASAIANRDSFAEYKSPDWFDYDESDRVNARAPGYSIDAPDAEGRRIWKMVALFQAGYVGAPMIYYGTEAGMYGADDPDDRMPMWWPEMEFAKKELRPDGQRRAQAQPTGFDSEIFAAYQQTLALRNQHVALRRGNYTVVEACDKQQVFAFMREFEDESLILVFNRGSEAIPLDGDYLKGFEQIYTTDAKATRARLPGISAAAFLRHPAE